MTGYVVLWHSKVMGVVAMFQSTAADSRGVLFNPSRGAATLFPTRKQAAGAIRRSMKYWKDGFNATNHYQIVTANDRGIA